MSQGSPQSEVYEGNTLLLSHIVVDLSSFFWGLYTQFLTWDAVRLLFLFDLKSELKSNGKKSVTSEAK